MSCVSIFAFIDKEGIISETAKYVDELAVIDKENNKVVLDMVHDSHVINEDETYTFENESLYKEKVQLLKALSLAFMCAKNPKVRDTQREMVEVFLTPPEPPKEEDYTEEKDLKRAMQQHVQKIEEYNEIIESLHNEIGFQFHTSMKYEADAHQDCVCALAKLIGHTDASF